VWAAWAILGASLVGLAINLYFVSLFYRVPAWLTRALGRAAHACGVDGGSCARVVATPYARLLRGHPNVVVGLPWCVVTMAFAAVYLVTGTFPLWWACLGVGAASVLVGAYLTYVLFFVLKDP
jgi:uncharacterized membrane protein